MSTQLKEKGGKKPLGERLVEAGLIDEIQLAVALGMQKQTGLKIGKQLLKLGFVSEEELSPFLSEHTDMSISLAQRNITAQTLKAIPQDLAFKYKVVPVAYDGKTIVLAMSDPKDITVIDALAFRLSKKIHPVKALEWDLDTALLKYYSDFTDEEISRLTSASSSAEQYQSAQWSVGKETNLEGASGISLEPTSYADAEELSKNDEAPMTVIAGHDDWTANPFDEPAGPKQDAVTVNPLQELTPLSESAPPQKKVQPQAGRPAAPQQRPSTPRQAPSPQASRPQPAPQRPQAPQQSKPAPKPPAAAPRPEAPAPQKSQAPPKQQAKPEQPTPANSSASDAISALASTARKRFTVQQALIDLLIEKKVISERDLLNKLIKLEGSLSEDE